MCARPGQAAHLSNLALQFFDCVELPLPAVLSGHFVLPTASDVAAKLHLENRSLSSLGLSAALCSQEKYFVLKKRLCFQEKHFVLSKCTLFSGRVTCSEVRPGLASISLKVSTGLLITSQVLQNCKLMSCSQKDFFFIFKKCGSFVVKKGESFLFSKRVFF